MIKWDLILDNEAFYYLHHTPRIIDNKRKEIREYQDLLEQHNIVFSNSLRDLYEKYYYENAIGELDELETFFDDLISYSSIDNPGKSISYTFVTSAVGGTTAQVLSGTASSLGLKMFLPA